MYELVILDASAIVYTGELSSQKYGKVEWSGFPCGGLRVLNRYITNALAEDDTVVIAFDSPSFRSEQNEEYKSGRTPNVNVISQLKLAYEMLNKAGITCTKVDGYEADDIIDWAAKSSDSFGTGKIIGNDYDLIHSINDKIQFMGCSSNVMSINSVTYPALTRIYPGLKWNTISAYKTIFGCKSDKIKPFSSENGLSNTEIYNQFIEFTKEKGLTSVAQQQNVRLFVLYLKNNQNITNNDKNALLKRAELVYPAEQPEGAKVYFNTIKNLKRFEMSKYLTLIGDQKSMGVLGIERANLTDKDKQILDEYKKMLISGSFAIDNNIPIESELVEALPSNIFTRDF